MKVYFMEMLGEAKANFICVDHSQRAKVWVQCPGAKEISKKQYDQVKYDYEKTNKEVAK